MQWSPMRADVLRRIDTFLRSEENTAASHRKLNPSQKQQSCCPPGFCQLPGMSPRRLKCFEVSFHSARSR